MKRWVFVSYVLLFIFSFLNEASAREEESVALAAQLIEARCTKCHSAFNYENKNHSWPGWAIVVFRMELFNGATLKKGERIAIVDYLAETNPPSAARALTEYFMLILPILIFIASINYYFRKRSTD